MFTGGRRWAHRGWWQGEDIAFLGGSLCSSSLNYEVTVLVNVWPNYLRCGYHIQMLFGAKISLSVVFRLGTASDKITFPVQQVGVLARTRYQCKSMWLKVCGRASWFPAMLWCQQFEYSFASLRNSCCGWYFIFISFSLGFLPRERNTLAI